MEGPFLDAVSALKAAAAMDVLFMQLLAVPGIMAQLAAANSMSGAFPWGVTFAVRFTIFSASSGHVTGVTVSLAGLSHGASHEHDGSFDPLVFAKQRYRETAGVQGKNFT